VLENVTSARNRNANDGAIRGPSAPVTVKKGDSASSILRELGANPDEAKAISRRRSASVARRRPQGGAKTAGPPGHDRPPVPTQRLQPARSSSPGQGAEAVARPVGHGKYVRSTCTASTRATRSRTPGDDEEDDGRGVRLYQSVYETALRHKVPARSSTVGAHLLL